MEKDLDAMNEYLVKFRGKYYGPVILKNDILYFRYRDGGITQVPVNEVAGTTYSEKDRTVKLLCKDDRPCAHYVGQIWKPYLDFKNIDKTKDPAELSRLMNTFFSNFKVYNARLKASKNPGRTSPDPGIRELQQRLLQINDQMRIFRLLSYNRFAVEDGRLVFDDGWNVKTRAMITDLDEVRYDSGRKKMVYISCIGGKNCVEDLKHSKLLSRMDFPDMPENKARDLYGMMTPFIHLLKKKMNSVLQEQKKQQKVQKPQTLQKQKKSSNGEDEDVPDAFFGD